jgi:sugar phosphate isomerase/epimerase
MPRTLLDGKPVQLSYSTNVHAARDLDELEASLAGPAADVRHHLLGDERTLGLSLHIGARTALDLAGADRLDELREVLGDHGLEAFAINAFPLGDFHAAVVKENAYAPDWTTRERLETTLLIADLFARLLPEGATGTLSTLAGSYKPWGDDFTIHERIAAQLVEAARRLGELAERTGRTLVLGLEPEPFTTLETTEEVITFWQRHVEPAARNAALPTDGIRNWRSFLGLNVDLCHQAVLFEDLPASLDRLADAGIRIGSVHAAAALEADPREPGALEHLAAFAEARYLHQVVAVDDDARLVLREPDLPALLARPPEELARLARLRCHFHVPLDGDHVGGLPTTAPLTAAALRHLLARDLTRDIVAETYTWGIGPLAAPDVPARIAGELRWLIDQLGLSLP